MQLAGRQLPLALFIAMSAGCIFGSDRDPDQMTLDPEDGIVYRPDLSGLGGDDDADGNDVDRPFEATTDCPEDQTPTACAVIDLVNRERSERGLPAFRYNYELALAAYGHAEDMSRNNYFSHGSPDGRSFSDRVVDAGYDAFPRAENIARGHPTPEDVMVGWMNSDGHRRNILDTTATELGVGHVTDGNFWVQNFGAR